MEKQSPWRLSIQRDKVSYTSDGIRYKQQVAGREVEGHCILCTDRAQRNMQQWPTSGTVTPKDSYSYTR